MAAALRPLRTVLIPSTAFDRARTSPEIASP
jgi:hypothetical protein